MDKRIRILVVIGAGPLNQLHRAAPRKAGSTACCYWVKDPIVVVCSVLKNKGHTRDIEEKPNYPKRNSSVTGLYFIDNPVFDIPSGVRASARAELKIIAAKRVFLKMGAPRVEKSGRGITWLDNGTHETPTQA
jgi:glucose-1-phosphate thymidylyltransferase